MGYGTVVGPVRSQLLTLLRARPGLAEVAVGYDAPTQQSNVYGPTGLRRSIWMDPNIEGATGETIALGTPSHRSETWDLTVLCQALPSSTADTQEVADDTVCLMAGEVTELIDQDPTLGGLDALVAGWTIRATVTGFSFDGGPLLNSAGTSTGAAARIALNLQVTANNC